jgi:hypothetical protein
MKNTLRGLLLLIDTASAALADTTYTILGIADARGDEQILVERAWRKDAPKRILAKVRASEDTPATKIVAKAYFYDANKKLIYTYPKPCLRWMSTKKGVEEVGLPSILEKNDTVEIYFALTPELLKMNPKTTLIVFGDGSNVVVKSKNEVSPMDFDFPEKSKVSGPKK